MQFGCHTLLSDRGAAFRSKLMKHLCQLIGVKQIFTSSRHPQTNSRCEAYNKNILNSLRTTVENKQDWPKLLASIGHSFRCTVVPHLGFSPYEIVFGIKPYLSFDNLLLSTQNLPTNMGQYLAQMTDRLAIVRETVRRNQTAANAQTATQYNAKRHTKLPEFKTTDRVWLYSPNVKGEKLLHKITPKYKGPFLILKRNPIYHVYQLQNCKTQKVLASWVHASRLRLYNDSRDRFYTPAADFLEKTVSDRPSGSSRKTAAEHAAVQNNKQPSAEADRASLQQPTDKKASTAPTESTDSYSGSTGDVADTGWQEITDVLKHRRYKGRLQFLVQWKDDTTSWVPQEDVTDYSKDIYWCKRADKPKRRRKRRM